MIRFGVCLLCCVVLSEWLCFSGSFVLVVFAFVACAAEMSGASPVAVFIVMFSFQFCMGIFRVLFNAFSVLFM